MTLPGPDYPAPAKLNLFLHVVGRRPDGYHLVQSVFVPIDFSDTLRFRVRTDGVIARVTAIPGVAPEDDLVVRAARALQRACGTSLGADIAIEKRIPMGGGLGGGSSDAATTLMVLDRLWGAGTDAGTLDALGLGLGADVPFFLRGRPAWVEGIGERIYPLHVPERWYVVLAPPVAVPTRDVFAAPELTRDTEILKMEDFSRAPGEAFGARVRNDLQAVVEYRVPEVAAHLAWLSRHGQARMTGSGACVFAAFETREQAQVVIDALPGTMTGFIARGLQDHPLRTLWQ